MTYIPLSDLITHAESVAQSTYGDTISVEQKMKDLLKFGRNQTATLNGQTRVALTTPLNRLTRIRNNSGTNLIGNIYGYENTAISSGKPSDTTKIHATIPAGKNTTFKASTSLSSDDYWLITNFYCDMLSKAAAYAKVSLQIREPNKTFIDRATISCSNGHQGRLPEGSPLIIVPKNSDVRLVAVGSGSIQVSGGIIGLLAKVV